MIAYDDSIVKSTNYFFIKQLILIILAYKQS